MSPLVLRGRAAELATVLRALTRAEQSGEGGVVLVTGEPGIGKTALVREVREQARRRGFAVGSGAAAEPHQLVPGAPLLLALRSGREPLLDATVPERLGRGDAQPLWLAEELVDQLERRAQAGPVLVVLDDVQWADPLSRFLMRVVAGRLAGSPVVWVLAARSDPRAGGRTADAAEAFDDARVEHVPLSPLRHADLVELVTDVLGSAPDVAVTTWLEQIGGSPLLAATLAEGIADGGGGADPARLPTGFAQRLRSTLAALGPDALALARLTAVWARPLPVADAADVLHRERAAIEDDVASRPGFAMISIEDDALTYRHDLIREFVHHQIPEVERVRLHRLCAYRLMDGGRPAVEAAPHAVVSARAGDHRSLEIVRQAAADSLLLVPHTAADLMGQAFEAVARNDPRWAATGEQYANALWHAQRGADCIAVVDRLLAAAVEPDVRARLHVLAAQSLWLMGLPEDITVRTERQLSAPSLDQRHRAQLEASRALALSQVGTPAEAWSAAEAALATARELDDAAALRIALHALGQVARNEGRHHMAYACFHELRTSFGADFTAQEITSLQHLDRFDDAQSLLTRAADRAGRDAPGSSPALASAQVWQHINLARNDEADVAARALIRLGDELGNYAHRNDAYTAMSIVALVHGDLTVARAIVDTAEAEGTVEGAPGLLLMRARIAHAGGDHESARRWLRVLSSTDTAAHTYWSRSLAQLRFSAGVALATKDDEFAEQVLHRAVVAAERNPGVPSFQGVALQLRGVFADDLDLLGAAVDVLRGCPRPLLRAGAIVDLGSALLAAGHRADGIRHLDEALVIFDRVGSPLPADATRRALFAAGVRRRRRASPGTRPAAGPGSLTDAEQTVARLVVAGHTNRSAADHLGVSANTVGTHLSSIFAKVGVRSRVQLANALRESAPLNAAQNPPPALR